MNNSFTFTPAMGGSIAVIDYDQDGDKDMIIAGENNGSVQTHLYSNNGSGLFSLVPNAGFQGITMGDIAVADTDNDGDQDVLLGGSLGGSSKATNLYLNNGNGTFSLLANTVFWATFLSTLDFADFDLDGDPDILITGSISGAQFAAQVYENAGSNSFIPADTLVPAYRTSTAIADLDGDTDPDLVILGITNASNPFRTIAYNNTAMVVAVKGPDAAQATQAWPNPTAGLVHIDSGREGRQQLLLYNAAGELVFQTKANARGITLDLQPYSPGIYVAKVIPEGSPAGFIKLIRGDTRYVNSR